MLIAFITLEGYVYVEMWGCQTSEHYNLPEGSA